jgi:hypothetical protein
MSTRLILASNAVFFGVVGALLTFMPSEIISFLEWQMKPIIFQLLGSLYFGFAMINWMSKANLIGGIYNRPLAVGNLSHFVIGALALIKMPDKTTVGYCLTTVYSIYAVAFGLILFTHPIKESKTE